MSAILEKDKRFVWHPFTQHATERDPIVIKSAKGASLFDEHGNEMLDMISSWWTCIHGHAHPAINQALKDQVDQMEHVMFSGFTHQPASDLSEKLAELLPGDLNRTFFSDNGSTAVEIALKIAYQYYKNAGEHGRTKFLAFDGGYHGETLGAMSVGRGCGFFKLFEGLMCSIESVPYAYTWDGDEQVEQREADALAALQSKLEQHKHETAALIVEPLMQGAGGVRFCRPEFIKQVVDMAHAHDVLVIFDEVAVGFGRSGSMFACEKAGVVPDLICLSKGLTAGYLPMAVTVATNHVFERFLDQDPSKMFLHSHTFCGNPLACAVANASLKLFETEKTLERIAHIEKRHSEQLAQLHAHPMALQPRVMGSVLAFNLAGQNDTIKSIESVLLRDWFWDLGLNIRPLGNVIYLMPPYCITDDQLDRAYTAIFEGLEQFTKKAA
ncbi:MAG: adenosylmethionine--8-amino-7-oxononanoate transaminase [Pseudomonadota bacterium]